MDFSRKYRITKTKDFIEVYNLGNWFNDPLLDVSVKSNTLGITRLGLSVSKSLGNAHERNLIKRRVRNLFISTKNIKKGWDIVVIPKKKSLETEYKFFRKTFMNSLQCLCVIPITTTGLENVNEK